MRLLPPWRNRTARARLASPAMERTPMSTPIGAAALRPRTGASIARLGLCLPLARQPQRPSLHSLHPARALSGGSRRRGYLLCKSSTRSCCSPGRRRHHILRRPLSGRHADGLRHASPRSQSKPRPRPELGTLTRHPSCSWSPRLSQQPRGTQCLQLLRPLQLPGGLLWWLSSAQLPTLAARPTAAAPVAAGRAGSARAPTASAWPSSEGPRLKPRRASSAARSVLALGHRRRSSLSLASWGI